MVHRYCRPQFRRLGLPVNHANEVPIPMPWLLLCRNSPSNTSPLPMAVSALDACFESSRSRLRIPKFWSLGRWNTILQGPKMTSNGALSLAPNLPIKMPTCSSSIQHQSARPKSGHHHHNCFVRAPFPTCQVSLHTNDCVKDEDLGPRQIFTPDPGHLATAVLLQASPVAHVSGEKQVTTGTWQATSNSST